MKTAFTFAALSLAGSMAFAAPITPAYDSFGSLAAATFGGSGIPNDAVAVTNVGSDLTLGLTAHQRFTAPALTHNGAGVFTAQTGISAASPSPAIPYALWNVGFYIGGTGLAQYTFVFSFDFDPAANTDAEAHGTVTTPGELLAGLPSLGQDSWNMGMDFLTSGMAGVLAPTFGAFDPSVAGQYTFSLAAYEGDALAGVSAIQVNVEAAVSEVPEPASLALFSAALLGLAAARRRKG